MGFRLQIIVLNEGVSLEITPSVARSGEITIEIIPEIKTSARSTEKGQEIVLET